MSECKVFVSLEKDQYEELISRRTQLEIIEKAYKGMELYRFDEFMKVLFNVNVEGK
jgi:hypothetical protein